MNDELLDDDNVEEADDDIKKAETKESGGEFDTEETLTDSLTCIAAKELERQRLQAEVEAFLANGGKINVVEPNVLADPPRKPESNYGGQPI